MRAASLSLALLLLTAPAAAARTADPYALPVEPAIQWHSSRATGKPLAGRLVRGVKRPAEGPDWFTWDPALNRRPDRAWRRYGTDKLVRMLLQVVRDYRDANPGVARVGILRKEDQQPTPEFLVERREDER